MVPALPSKSLPKCKTRDGRITKRTSKHKDPSASRVRTPTPMQPSYPPNTKKNTWAGSLRQYLSRVKDYLFTSTTSIHESVAESDSEMINEQQPALSAKHSRVLTGLPSARRNVLTPGIKACSTSLPAVLPTRAKPRTNLSKTQSQRPLRTTKLDETVKCLKCQKRLDEQDLRNGDEKLKSKQALKRTTQKSQKRLKVSNDSDSTDS